MRLAAKGHALNRAIKIGVIAALASACGLSSACKKQQSDNDAIRSGINQHLASLRSLNLGAMDMDLNSVSIQGSQAHAQVTFRPKTGAPSGAGMQVAYDLEKKDAGWVVVKTGTMGGMIDHPAGNAPGQPPADSMHGNLPNFRDMLTPATPGAAGTLPPGHPPVNATPKPNPDTTKQ
jgi:hypothetical protein